MNNNIHIIILVFTGGGLILAIYSLILEMREVLLLKTYLKKVIGKTKIKTIEDFVKIKKFLNSHIEYDTLKRYKKRPLLRHTSTYILKNKYGFCGENARVAIKLLIVGGIKARRIYLYRKEWQHVLIEHQFNKNWYMFDGHFDPNTLLRDNSVCSIPSENINEYPDGYSNNPYLDFCRLKVFKEINFLNRFSKIKLPILIVYILESPYLIKSILFIVFSIFSLLFLI